MTYKCLLLNFLKLLYEISLSISKSISNCILIIVFIFKIVFIFFVFLSNILLASEKKSYFVGHAYGYHGNKDVPDLSLQNFLKKNDHQFLLFGGDMTENSDDFIYFKNYFKDTNFLAVRGNHDGNLYSKIPFWIEEVVNEKKIFNLDMDSDMKFNYKILEDKNDTIIVQHYLWFLRLFSYSPINFSEKTFKEKIILKLRSLNFINVPLVNSMYSSSILEKEQLEKINFGKNNIYISGDCGAFKKQFTYSKTIYKGNIFICSGIGSQWANNVVDLNTLNPVFFNIDGNVVDHSCKKKKGNFDNIVEFCLPNHKNSEYLWKLLK